MSLSWIVKLQGVIKCTATQIGASLLNLKDWWPVESSVKFLGYPKNTEDSCSRSRRSQAKTEWVQRKGPRCTSDMHGKIVGAGVEAEQKQVRCPFSKNQKCPPPYICFWIIFVLHGGCCRSWRMIKYIRATEELCYRTIYNIYTYLRHSGIWPYTRTYEHSFICMLKHIFFKIMNKMFSIQEQR